MRKQNRTTASPASRKPAFFEPLESLEQRRMMSASFDPMTRTLTVTGSGADDTVTVGLHSPPLQPVSNVRVIENGAVTYDSPLRVDRIIMNGNDGNDSISISSAITTPATVNGGAGNDALSGGGGHDRLDGWTGDDQLTGNNGNDVLLGYSGHDQLNGNAGDDQMWGEGNDDLLNGGGGADAMSGGSGTDMADYAERGYGVMVSLDGVANDGVYTNAPPVPDPVSPYVSTEFDNVHGDVENFRGGSGNDRVTATDAQLTSNRWFGNGGNDHFESGGGADWLDGGEGDDNLQAGDGDDTGAGGSGNDVLSGDAGADRLDAGTGNDVMYGGGGADLLNGDTGADTFWGGLDVDTADYSTRGGALNISLDDVANDGSAGEGDNVRSDVENVTGGIGNDTITSPANRNVANTFTGGSGADVLDGGGGNDVLAGGFGNDLIRGGNGNDEINGDANNDVLYGDAGADVVRGGDNDDRLYGGADADLLEGGNHDDVLTSIGGGTADRVKGEGGFDSFWIDSDATERIEDALLGPDHLVEAVNGNVHRIGSFERLRTDFGGFAVTQTVSKELNGQDFFDPVPNMNNVYTAFANRPLFPSTGASKDDVEQRSVGDCWFMATLSAVAKVNPNRIEQSVCDLGDGTYAVRFWDGSDQRYYRVDNQLAVGSAGSTAPVFAALGTQNSMWVAVMEKAFCFFRDDEGTYASISGGWPDEAFSALGVQDVDSEGGSIWGYSATELANDLAAQLASSKAVVFCTEDEVPDGSMLVGNHCYLVDRVNRDSSGNVSSIVMRNPWGPAGSGGYVTVTPQQARDVFDEFQYASV